MRARLIQLPEKQSFFLFGVRGSGKTTLLRQRWSSETTAYVINLLNPETEDRFSRRPESLIAVVNSLPSSVTHIIIDEIQKAPRLLNVIHHLIETSRFHFVMTGSSARKIKYGAANLLAGRAFVYHLHPFSALECDPLDFNLNHYLQWGMLPKIHALRNDEERFQFLQAYSLTYLKEEIWAEHLVRRLEPFRQFLEVAAQSNGTIINYASIARDSGIDDKTAKEYFSVLEDTLLGVMLPPFHHSFRKRLHQKPKFYFCDTGIVRALTRTLTVELLPQTSVYGAVFEHFIILEAMKLAQYYFPEYRFSYLRTKDDLEIDLVVERPGRPLLLIEIKSTTDIKSEHLRTLAKVSSDPHLGPCEAVCISQEPYPRQEGPIKIMPWKEALIECFTPHRTKG